MEYWGYIILAIMLLLSVYFVCGLTICYEINKKIFHVRGKDPSHPVFLLPEDFPSLARVPYQNQNTEEVIRGYLYTDKKNQGKKGFIILSHGLFGTHLQYICDIHFLTEAGYQVLAYDQFGVGESDGESQVSLSKGLETLNAVIEDVTQRNLHQSLPIYLYGHSWGAYCCLGVLSKHPEISKAVCRSGPIDPIKARIHLLELKSKTIHHFFFPILTLCCFLLTDKQERYHSVDGMKKNKTSKVLVVYSKDDPMVEKKNSQAYFFEKNPNPQVKVVVTEKGLHNSIITEESYQKFVAKAKEYKEIQKETDENKKARLNQEFISSLDRAEMLTYQSEVEEAILTFLD